MARPWTKSASAITAKQKLPYRGRFAPSPTGRLHFGSLVAALASYLEARSHSGAWLVRMEDLDPPRDVAGAAQAILESLAAFGMVSDEPVWFQRRRGEAYRGALEQLKQDDLVFRCACTRRNLPASGIYPGTCRFGLPAGRAGRSWRLRADPSVICVHDGLQGDYTQRIDLDVGDFVVRRADKLTAYHLAVVVDDAAQGITDIVRGADLLDSTPRQVYLQQCLGLPSPVYAHVPVAADARGRKLSKQTSALPVDKQNPAPALRAALRFLGQEVPSVLDYADLKSIWRFAEEQWSLANVPRALNIAV